MIGHAGRAKPLRDYCTGLMMPCDRKRNLIDDVRLLGDVADAFKHHKLNRRTPTTTGAKAVVTLGSGYGEMHSGEGKYGGAEQVLVIQQSGGKRALSAILQNVFDAWMRLLPQPLPPVGQY